MTVAGNDLSLTEKRNSETRRCPACSLAIDNPFIGRCPRCYSQLPAIHPDCPGCIHRLVCPAAVEPPAVPAGGRREG